MTTGMNLEKEEYGSLSGTNEGDAVIGLLSSKEGLGRNRACSRELAEHDPPWTRVGAARTDGASAPTAFSIKK